MPKSKTAGNSYDFSELFDFLSIPSISAQSIHQKDIYKAVKWLSSKISNLGFKTKILPTRGQPVLFAENLKAGKDKPTVLVYGHYDVQAPDPLKLWKTDPFKAVIKNGSIYARGAADDKGQFYTWIAALEKLYKNDKKYPVNIKLLVEGEEEVGSKNFISCLKKHKKILGADICLISDTHCLSVNQPMIDYGLRGLAYEEIKVTTLEKDVHSGTYGGNVLNPLMVLAQIISKLKDQNHNILIPKFYEKVRKLSLSERKELNKGPCREAQIKKETGAKIVDGEKGFTVHERAGARPTLEINGILGGYTAEGPKTVIPAEASAKISMRLVPNQTSSEIHKKFLRFIKKITPKGVKIEIRLLSTAEPTLMKIDSKYFKLAEKAYKKVFGKLPLYELSGGSIGAIADIKEVLKIDSITMGYGLPDDGLHSPNEKLSIKMFEKGVKTNIEFLTSI